MKSKTTYSCGHDDCFTCPYPDCISHNASDGIIIADKSVPVKLRKSLGVCVECGKHKAVEGMCKCEKCKEKESLRRKARYAREKGAKK